MYKTITSWVILLFIFTSIFTPVVDATSLDHPDRHYQRGQEFVRVGNYEGAVTEYLNAIKQHPTAAYYRGLGEAYEALERYQEAAEAFYSEADIREKAGDLNGAIVQRRRGDGHWSEIALYIEENKQPQPPTYTLGKFEPAYGTYFGAYVHEEPQIGNEVNVLNTLVGKQHSSFFLYQRYGQEFPAVWVERVKSAGAAAHLSVQPEEGLQMIQDDAYLREWARAAKTADVPIFLRFASEMNGAWVAWHDAPSKYIEKFRLVSKVMKEEAPNVAMVWTPNFLPQGNINDFYPGDDYVDWVGVNFYVVHHNDNDINRPADGVNPLDQLDYVYSQYSDRKPIQISETAVTHYCKVVDREVTDFAIQKMRTLYQGLEQQYPRVKMINWFSNNTIVNAANPERRNNNYSLLDNERVLREYSSLVGGDYFLEEVVNGPSAPDEVLQEVPVVEAFANGREVSGEIKFSSWVKLYDPYPQKVTYRLNGKDIATVHDAPYEVMIDTSELENGRHNLEVIAYDSKGKVAYREGFNFRVVGGKEAEGSEVEITQ